MLRVIRSLLLKIVDDIDAGNSNISEGEAIEIVDSLKRFTDQEDNDEVDAYLITYIYDKITSVFYKHDRAAR